tara:strand:+ start:7743 stop:8396 length:654 start_codon:yes stop_codon:yes gene_type:complete
MRIKFKFLSILLVSLITISSYSQTKPVDFDYGKVKNNKYVNSFFNCELNIPTDWVVQTKEQIETISNKGKELIAGDDANMKAMMKTSQVNSANLLSVFQYERGAPVDYNSSISIVAENVKNLPGIKSGSDYLFQVKKMLTLSKIKFDSIAPDFKKETINNTVFYKMDAGITIMGINIKQSYYSTIVNGFSFSIVMSYTDEEQKNILLESINSLQFKK